MLEEKLIATEAELAACCEQLAACEHIGFDTEFVGEDSFHPHLCLIQVAMPHALCLIDPFTVGALDVFWKIITDPAREIVVHAGREEVRMCNLWSGRGPGKIFDVQIAAGLTGLSYPMSHAALISEVLGEQLIKGETLTEWRERPLTPSQIRYAFDDVRYLVPAREKLHARLQELERVPWADEEFARLREHLPASTSADGYSERWRKLRGLGGLSRRQLAIVREVFSWRETLAAHENRPPRVLLRDDLVIEVARRNPKTDRDLKVMRGLPRRFSGVIMEAIERARALPSVDLPTLADREQDPPQMTLLVNVLAAVLADQCTRKQLAASLVAANQDLKRLVRARLGDCPLPDDSLLTQGWRSQHVLPELLAVLDGQRGLVIADIKSEAPFGYISGPAATGGEKTADQNHGVV